MKRDKLSAALIDGFLTLHRHCSKPTDTMPGAGRYWAGIMADLLKENPRLHAEIERRLK